MTMGREKINFINSYIWWINFMVSVQREKMNLPPKCAFTLQWSNVVNFSDELQTRKFSPLYSKKYFLIIWWKNFGSKCFLSQGCVQRHKMNLPPKMCIYATVINVVNFSDGLQTRKFSPPYFLVAATVLNGFCKFSHWYE